jgi:RNA polymerase sigma-70 factor (ECF subfamily)
MNEETISETGQIEDSKRNPKSFEPLYKKYYEPIIRFVYKRMESIEEARELTAVVFAKALLNIGKYTQKGQPFSAWLYRIAINEINQFYRHTAKIRVININSKAAKYIAEENNMPGKENISVLSKALLFLEEEDIELIELRFFEERPFEEIGNILEITGNNAKVRTYRAIDKLREIFTKLEN